MATLQKILRRITHSRWTKAYLALACLQGITIAILQSIIAHYHYQQFNLFLEQALDHYLSLDQPHIIAVTLDRIMRMMWENIAFAGFQIWFLAMAFDATIYQNAAEVITLAILNILCSILAGLQVANGKRWHKTLGELAVQYHYTFSLKPIENAISVEIASTVLLGISAISFAYLSYVVVREFGWVIYKKIGADVAMQRMYRTFQFFVLALKIDTFLEFLISGFYVLQVIVDSLESFEWIKEWDTWIELVVTVMVLPMLYFGRMAVSAESKKRMILFILFQILVVFQFLLVLRQTVDPDDFWYTWMCFVLVGMVFALTTAILGFLCMRNFNQGLAPHVQRGSKKKKHTDHLALSKHTSNSSWKIDDDEDD